MSHDALGPQFHATFVQGWSPEKAGRSIHVRKRWDAVVPG